MFPFGNNYSQHFMPEMFSSTPFYPNPYAYMPNHSFPFWNTISYEEPLQQHSQSSPAILLSSIEPEMLVQVEINLVPTRDQPEKESQLSVSSPVESSQNSPDLRLRQKYGRNINSNIYHHMVKKIGSEPFFQTKLRKLFATNDYIITEKEFYDLLSKRFGKLRTYVSLKKMRDLFRGSKPRNRFNLQLQRKEQEFYQIYRIICRIYLKEVHICHVFNGLRIKPQSREYHICGARKIGELVS